MSAAPDHVGVAEQGKVLALAGDHETALVYYREAMRAAVDAAERHGKTVRVGNVFSADLFYHRNNDEETRRGYSTRHDEELRAGSRTIRNFIHHVATQTPYCAFATGASIWLEGGSPLEVGTRAIAGGVGALADGRFEVAWCYRYGEFSVCQVDETVVRAVGCQGDHR